MIIFSSASYSLLIYTHREFYKATISLRSLYGGEGGGIVVNIWGLFPLEVGEEGSLCVKKVAVSKYKWC